MAGARFLMVICLLAMSGACARNDTYGGLSAVVPTPSAPQPSAGPRIIDQYVEFWREALPAAFAAPAGQRAGILTATTTDPQLDLLLDNMAALDSNGEKGYGANRPINQSVQVRGDTALALGCLDSSHAGILDVTGKPRTRGPARNAVRVTLASSDGSWKVTAVTYPDRVSC